MTRGKIRTTGLLLTAVAAASACSTRPTLRESNASSTQTGSLIAKSHRPPPTRRDTTVNLLHGTRVMDPYRWIEDGSSSDVKTWMESQDAYAKKVLSTFPPTPGLLDRAKSLLYADERSAPLERNGRFFYWIKPAHAEKAKWLMQTGTTTRPRVILDPLAMHPDGSVSIGWVKPSWDGKLVAYAINPNNMDQATIQVSDVDTGVIRETDSIPRLLTGIASWARDSKGFYYTWYPQDLGLPGPQRQARSEIRYHHLGESLDRDIVLWRNPGDPGSWGAAYGTEDSDLVLVRIEHGESQSDLFVWQPTNTGGTLAPLAVGRNGRYAGAISSNKVFVLTNEGASNSRVFVTNANALGREHWVNIVPERTDVAIEDIKVIGHHLVLDLIHDAASELEIRTLDGRLVRSIDLPSKGTVSDLVGTPTQPTAYFTFESFNHAKEIFATSVDTGRTTSFAKSSAPLDSSTIDVDQVFFSSKDGTRIPMFLVHKKGLTKTPETPTLLSGYGGFNIPWPPFFSARFALWVESGGLAVFANLRGGGEYGENWHRAGMLDKKQNVFDDFIAAANWLIHNKYTDPRHLGIRGGSNGGLLVAAAMTQRPDLFGAVICDAPLTDMVRYHLFGQGSTWITEYGNPEKENEFQWLYGYSPYHRVRAGISYPALLMISPDSDDRVDPMHARKFVAAVQWAQSSQRPVLFSLERSAGHGGSDSRQKEAEELATQISFLNAVLRN